KPCLCRVRFEGRSNALIRSDTVVTLVCARYFAHDSRATAASQQKSAGEAGKSQASLRLIIAALLPPDPARPGSASGRRLKRQRLLMLQANGLECLRGERR